MIRAGLGHLHLFMHTHTHRCTDMFVHVLGHCCRHDISAKYGDSYESLSTPLYLNYMAPLTHTLTQSSSWLFYMDCSHDKTTEYIGIDQYLSIETVHSLNHSSTAVPDKLNQQTVEFEVCAAFKKQSWTDMRAVSDHPVNPKIMSSSLEACHCQTNGDSNPVIFNLCLAFKVETQLPALVFFGPNNSHMCDDQSGGECCSSLLLTCYMMVIVALCSCHSRGCSHLSLPHKAWAALLQDKHNVKMSNRQSNTSSVTTISAL